jgi:uncharacterized protein (TIGR04552 family)
MTGRQPKDRLKRLDEFTLADLESIRLILKGESVIDWHRLNFVDDGEVNDFIVAQEFQPGQPSDERRIEDIKEEAVGYLRRQLEYPIPKPVERASFAELLKLASGQGHRQTCACTILKCMHIIHHLDGRELLFMLPLSDQEVFHIVEEKVYRIIGSMLAGGFPIIEFVGGRKNKDSLYTKLLCKQETIAAQIYDKLRFRIVTRSSDDIFPVLQYLTKKLFPFSYVVPGQSINSLFNFRAYTQQSPHLRPMLGHLQGKPDVEFTPSDNTFSADSYRILHFVVDMPVRLPKRVLEKGPPAAAALGDIVFVICEFQLVDRETDASNELGDASHAKYKERQRKAVMRRLHLGAREMRLPPSVVQNEAPLPPKAAANDSPATKLSSPPTPRPKTLPPPKPRSKSESPSDRPKASPKKKR